MCQDANVKKQHHNNVNKTLHHNVALKSLGKYFILKLSLIFLFFLLPAESSVSVGDNDESKPALSPWHDVFACSEGT